MTDQYSELVAIATADPTAEDHRTHLDQIAELADQLDADPLGWGIEKDPDVPELLKAWRIESKSEAAWAMSKLAEYRGKQQENDTIADERITPLLQKIEAIKAWNRQENDKLEGSADYFLGQLRVWHMSLITADPNDHEAWEKEKNKTVKLPDGKVSVRKGLISTDVEDLDTFADWVNLHCVNPEVDAMLEAKYVPIKKAISTYIEATGEVPPGVRYERSEPKFEVKPEVSA